MRSKSRIAKYIVPIIQKYVDNHEIGIYVEPFCGDCSIIEKIKCKNRYALDLNKYLIELFKHLQNGGELPDKVTRELYSDVRSNKDNGKYPNWFVGCVGFLASYNGRFFDGGFAQVGVEITKNGERYRDYYQEAKRNLLNQIENLKDVKFICQNYETMKPVNCIVYCDPPYQGTKQYGNSKNFDYEYFWDMMRDWSSGNIVLISEENAPNDFKCIWQQEISRSIKSTDKSYSVEKLFIYNKI